RELYTLSLHDALPIFDLDRSVIFHSNNQALGKVVAAGGGDLPSVFAFYQEEMPRKGWTLVNSFQSNVGNLYYARPGTFVAITIEDRKSTRLNSSHVKI